MRLKNNYKYFRMDEIFQIKKGKRLTKLDMIDGDLNYIGAISDNNGIRQKIDAIKQFDGNCITVNYNGSVGEAFYQDQPFWASDDVNVLFLKNYQLNESLALYLITIIKTNKYRFSYGRKWTKEKMSETEISLPIDNNGFPDWIAMEKYIQGLNHKHISSTIQNHPMPIDMSEWKEFYLKDLFDIERGLGPRISNMEQGQIPFITSLDNNNGFTAVVDHPPMHEGNTLSVNRNGSVGHAFYQNKPYCSTEDVHIFNPKFNMNVYVGLFLCTIIKMEKYRYGYGRKWGIDRMKRTVIRLPSKTDGYPDWDYMESFIRSLPYSDRI